MSPDWHALKLTYNRPAAQWTEALPIGNGRLGAMVFGGVKQERLQLNEDTFWSGGPKAWNNPHALKVLPQVRELVFAGKYQEADQLCRQMHGPFNESYQPLGDLRLNFDGVGEADEYGRELDLDRAVATVRYRAGRAFFTREAFASFPDQVIVIRLTCDTPRQISFTATLDSLQHHRTHVISADTIVMTGRAPSYVEPSYIKSDDPVRHGEEGMTFNVRLRVIVDGGTVSSADGSLRVTGANAVTLLLSADTSFNGHLKSPAREGKDPSIEATRNLDAAAAKPFDELLRRHVADHQALFRRVSLDLGPATTANLPTDERLRQFHQTNDPQLAALLFQFGRYLMISSSRPGTQPANLQGIWNDLMRPPWSSNYTLNINAQMNYWPAESCNLSECHEPLLQYVAELAENGKETARVDYGCRGWVAHHNADLWRHSGPVGGGWGNPFWANWIMGGVWLCQHLWEHFAFRQDRKWLREFAWPVMKSAAEFCLDWLIEDGNGHLITNPSVSPEHAFMTADGKRCECSIASTMDMALIHDLFTNCIESSEVLGIEAEFAKQLVAARARLFPHQVGARGQLQEWFQDFADREVHHRHVSHLFGLHPGRQITPRTDPKHSAACRRSLEMRGDSGTGWSLGWKINLWARLFDGEHAYLLIRNLLTPAGSNDVHMEGGGLYANLFDAHPPFQIDGNFAYTAGIAEMLVQSHAGEIELLPALPSAWPNGQVTGLRARGGIEVALTWQAGKLTRADLKSDSDRAVRVRLGEMVKDFPCAAGSILSLDENLAVSFSEGD
jgi:alpha-L-fucosidase 2